MGIWELLPYLNQFRVRLKQTIEAALSFRPHVVLTVDSKGFSFRFLKHLRATSAQQGMVSPLHFHYVSPSFWAWKGGEARLKGLLQFVDHVLCILPFEAEVCRSNGLAATFVGHPTLEDISDFQLKDATERRYRIQGNAEAFLTDHGISSGSPVISLLPGSRLQEVTRMFPIFSSTLEHLKGSFPDLVTAVHVAPNQHVEDYIDKTVCKWPSVVLVPGGSHQIKYNSFSASSVALCTSGTVAMEVQLARLPCVVAYRAHLLTELVIRYKAIIPYISLPNILLDSAIIPEALFQDCTPSKFASLLNAVDSRSKVGDASENTDIRGESNPSKNNMDIEGIMSQMHDLSFMLETNLSIPSKSNNSLLRDFVHLVSLQDFCNQVDPVHVFYCKRI
ncbi:PREDICTED: probable lipid-A-disaccharide synthase, mitochondrial isoform X3 [Nicotiana attenuata]|nr:PREDICTED: probable lipid-A-disaccharide synthase, mitochondrial isoform X3 [Nicotiana attenuata]XP_019224217.1 PREDICTED: probable lipid-A-disaccharide synthase, mitochondrial isoform X3 [Nicotiana attenuata]XP_019224218.1 PREDICTED: probable lipid-A-disaccharide synthase, mitochondrial isoform X3 [Nicotiana attenuata]